MARRRFAQNRHGRRHVPQGHCPRDIRSGGVSFELLVLLGATMLFGAVITLGMCEASSGTNRQFNPAGAVREIVSFGDRSEMAVRYPTHCVLWDPRTRTSRPLWLPPCAHRCAVLAGCHARSQLLVGWEDGWLILLEIPSRQVIWRRRPVGNGPTRALFSPDGTSLAVTSLTGELALLDAATGYPRWKTPATGDPRMDVCFSPDGRRLFAPQQRRGVVVLDAKTGATVSEILIEGSFISAIAVGPRGHFLAMGTEAGEVMLWDLAGKKFPYRERFSTATILTIGFSPDAGRLIYATNAGVVAALELGREFQHRMMGTHDAAVFAMAYNDDTLVTGSTDGVLHAWPRTAARPNVEHANVATAE